MVHFLDGGGEGGVEKKGTVVNFLVFFYPCLSYFIGLVIEQTIARHLVTGTGVSAPLEHMGWTLAVRCCRWRLSVQVARLK